eukprot:9090788-Alexandrium_andersonii.AAC.1
MPGHKVLVVKVTAVHTPEREECRHVALDVGQALRAHLSRFPGHDLVDVAHPLAGPPQASPAGAKLGRVLHAQLPGQGQ